MMPTRWNAARGLAIALVLAAWCFGCGVKSAPIAPELARPQRIVDLRTAADAGGIKLVWERPTHYAGGHSMRDLDSFVVLRAAGDGALEPLVEIPVTDRERFSVERDFTYVDGETVLGRRYRYQVVSKTIDGYTSEPSNETVFVRIKPRAQPNPENFQFPKPSPLPSDLP